MPAPVAAWLLCRRLPQHVFIEPTNRCNLSCPLCLQPNHPRERGCMGLEDFRRIADELRRFASGLIMHLLGESLLNEDFFEMVRHAESLGLQCTFTTNGELLDRHIGDVFDSRLTAICVCLDGVDRETHRRYRTEGDFDRVRASIVELCAERRRRGTTRPHVAIQNLALRFNVEQRGELEAWARSVGVDQVVYRALHLGLGKVDGAPEELAAEYLPEEAGERGEDGEAVGLCRSGGVCGELHRATILWNGDVVPCMRSAWNAEETFGNVLKDGGFRSVWRSRRHREFLRRHIVRGGEACRVKELFDAAPRSGGG